VGVGDPAVVDAELLQPGLPFLQLGPVGDSEREVVQAGTVLVEAVLVAGGRGVLVEGEEGAAGNLVDGVVVAGGVFVQDRPGAQEAFVPAAGPGNREDAVSLGAPRTLSAGADSLRLRGQREP
jgi:hypothetical protein